jgi:hypothetical protein
MVLPVVNLLSNLNAKLIPELIQDLKVGLMADSILNTMMDM